MNANKLLVWIFIEGLSLFAWSEFVLSLIGSHWGKVIRIDLETVNKKRFDIARVLVGVQCLSVILPLVLSVAIEGRVYQLKISTVAFEDERCWIDNMKLNWRSECSLVFSNGDLG
ncbi:hypothetical protein V6N12_069148 [Hibiscus sabdariffa]|uniref:Uncharacterized protein n=1 Tax=Hibiscus sabdariffa TaxID=183260 RepID=A0ABR2FCZ5_9ROSI